MRRTTERILLALVAGVLAWVGAPWLGQSPAARANPLPASPLASSSVADSCLGQKKVWLLVVTDAGSTMRSTCVGTPSSGEQALVNAGLNFTYSRGGYLCTIGGYPASCPTTFTGQYWSYWTATPGGSWTYSNLGAGARTPPPGTLDGWCYTKAASEATQKATCSAQLTSRVNPANVTPTVPQPTTKPTTAQPTTAATTAKPTTAKPTTARPTTARPTASKASTSKGTTTRSTTTSSARTSSATSSSAASSRPSTPASTSTSKPATASSAPSTAQPGASSANNEQTTTASPSQPDASAEQTTVPATDSGSPTGLIATGGVLAAGAAGVGVYLLRARRR
ncbi:hypothetical protein ACSDQ9_12230 [Aestuariimicrobium soli]|uniref:hypothetical protein n=1 Tax=Aestuariimicrobium soli TaxID=2035834 RepID=UPI003EBB3245